MPKISVIIPVFNTEKYLSECLNSVINQTFKDIEIICVNDGSTDNSQKILEDYALKDSRIRVIKQENKGVIEARNRAIKEASGIYIYPLDSDDIIDYRTLDILYQAIFTGKGDVITCRVVYFGRLWQEFVLPKPNKYNLAYANCLVNAALFRKKDFIESGGYNPKYKTVLEDYDLWLNFVFRLNKKIYRVPEILFFYRLKDVQESRNSVDFSVHEKIRKSFEKKYPQIKFYRNLRKSNEKNIRLFMKISKPFRKLAKSYIKRLNRNRARKETVNA